MILDGVVFSWGRNDYGQLGHSLSHPENRISMQERLQHIEHIPRIIQLSVGSEHNVALTGTIKLHDKYMQMHLKLIMLKYRW